MIKNKIILASMLILTTALSVFADGETGHGSRSIIGYIYDAIGNIVEYIYC